MAPRACLWQSTQLQATVILGPFAQPNFRMPSSALELPFQGKAYAIPEKVVVDLLDRRNRLALSSFGTVVGVFVRCSSDSPRTSSVLERPTQRSDSSEAGNGVETQEEGLESQSCRFEKAEGKL
jgi:hypothetical protein